VTYRAVNAVVDNASVIVAEDLSRTCTGRRRLGADTNRRWAAWTKGITAEALKNVSGRRGSEVRLVNAAYTSQVIPGTRLFGRRVGTGCTARMGAGSCGTRSTPLRSPSWTEPPMPTSACTPRTGG
jgi:hypothetical protein